MANPLHLQLLLLGWLLALGLQMLWLHRQGTSVHYEQNLDEMREHIVWRAFYVNPDDPRAWVPKTWGHGMTVNFRKMSHAVLFAFLLAGALGTAIAMTVAVL